MGREYDSSYKRGGSTQIVTSSRKAPLAHEENLARYQGMKQDIRGMKLN
jgi:hypothetical protein